MSFYDDTRVKIPGLRSGFLVFQFKDFDKHWPLELRKMINEREFVEGFSNLDTIFESVTRSGQTLDARRVRLVWDWGKKDFFFTCVVRNENYNQEDFRTKGILLKDLETLSKFLYPRQRPVSLPLTAEEEEVVARIKAKKTH